MTCSLLGIVAASMLVGTTPSDDPVVEDKKVNKVAYTFMISGFGWAVPNSAIREVVAEGLGENASLVLCDSSATVTVYMKDDHKLSKGQIEEVFSASEQGKRWKPSNFRRESRAPAVVRYEVGFSGSTWQSSCLRVRAALSEHSAVVDAQVDGSKKTVTVLARKDELDEAKVTHLMKRKGFKVTKFSAEKLEQIGG